MAAQSNLKLEAATLEDIPALTDIWYAAFDTPFFRDLWPDTPGCHKWWDDTNRYDMLNKPFQHYVKVVDPDVTDAQGRPKVVAYGKWDLSTLQQRGRRYLPWSDEQPKQVVEDLFQHFDRERVRILGDQPHYYFDMLATRPEDQRRGAGSKIIQYGCDLADKDGVALWIDASDQGAPLYEKFGFVIKSPPSAGGVASMLRLAKT